MREFNDHMKKFQALSQLVEQTKDKAKKTVQKITQIEADLEVKALEAKNAHLEAEIAKRAKKNQEVVTKKTTESTKKAVKTAKKSNTKEASEEGRSAAEAKVE